MQRLGCFGLVLFLAGCSAAPRESVAPRRLLGHFPTAVRTDAAGERLPASVARLEVADEALPQEVVSLLASLLERRGWVLKAGGESPEAVFEISDRAIRPANGTSGRNSSTVVPASTGTGQMQWGTNGSGDILHRNRSYSPNLGSNQSLYHYGGRRFDIGSSVRRLEVEARGAGGATLWSGLAWLDTRHEAYVDDANDLALALADRLPVPRHPSQERVAIDRLGLDFVMILDPDQQLVPALLAVVSGSAPDRAGWAARDLLLSIDGELLSGASWARVAELLVSAESRPVEVEILRGGERFLTFLVPSTPPPIG